MELKTLCELQGVSGREERVRGAVYAACVKALGPEHVWIDKMGNVIAQKEGGDKRAPHVMLSAHMDEVGLMVVSATEDGLLRVRNLGGMDARVLVSKRVMVGYEPAGGIQEQAKAEEQMEQAKPEERTKSAKPAEAGKPGEQMEQAKPEERTKSAKQIEQAKPAKSAKPGVIGAMAIHLQSAEDRKAALPIDQLYVDIGAKDKEEALRAAPLGTPITFLTPFTPFGEGLYLARALDDRVGVYNLLRLLSLPCKGKTSFVFTCQEEVGCRGAQGAAFRLMPDIALALEGTAVNDVGDVPESQQVARVGQGVVISFMDHSSIAHPELFKKMLALAKAKGIAHQVKRSVSGGNEGGTLQRTGAGVKTCVLSVPCRYIHSPSTVCAAADVEAQYQLAKAYLENEVPSNV